MITFLISFLTSSVITYSLIRFQNLHIKYSGDHDFQSPQKFHKKIIPRIGGIGIFTGFTAAVIIQQLINLENRYSLFLIILAATPVFAIGFIEDIFKGISIKIRLMASFSSGIIFLYLFNVDSINLNIQILDYLLHNLLFCTLFLSFAITGLTNSYNIIDGFNGLASMVLIFVMSSILYVSFQVDDNLLINLSIVTIGSVLGFFIWNFPRGLIFLGDGGAYLIGFISAIASILLIFRNETVSPWFALAVNIYPIFETIFSIWRRGIRKGKNPGLADATHFHSLIYRRITFKKLNNIELSSYKCNAKASIYAWVLSLLFILPATFCWQSTTILIIIILLFIATYLTIYLKIISFKTPNFFKLF